MGFTESRPLKGREFAGAEFPVLFQPDDELNWEQLLALDLVAPMHSFETGFAESRSDTPTKERPYQSLVNLGRKVLGGIDAHLSHPGNLPRINSLDLTTHEVIRVAIGKSSLRYPHVIAGQLALEGAHDTLVETEMIIVAKV